MKYIVAVSGGVDSVVLLDAVWRTHRHELVVAHFDHGIRDESAADARFVRALAERYGVPFVMRREELGLGASEEFARQRRYEFLYEVAREYNGQIVTAHHQDDVIETMALNIMRGTRWRGIAGMSDERVLRPMVGQTKQSIYDYAARRQLEWCEDETNQSDRYTRNQVRRRLGRALDDKCRQELVELWYEQRVLRRNIEVEVEKFEPQMMSRYFLTNIPLPVAEELLYQYVMKRTGISLLSAQLGRLVVTVRTGRAGTIWYIAPHVRVKLTQKNVTIDRVD